MPNKRDITGQKFSRLKVIEDSGTRSTYQKILWRCICDCGTERFVIGANLINGNTRSCGCLQKEEARDRLFKHGNSKTPDYEKSLRLKLYNLTLEDLQNLYKTQNNKCAICGIDESELSKVFHIDHDHKTNKVRGLLCGSCNLGLGNFKDNSDYLNLAINYLWERKN